MRKSAYTENKDYGDFENVFLGIKDCSDLDFLIDSFSKGVKEADLDDDGNHIVGITFDDYNNLISDQSFFSNTQIIGAHEILYKEKISLRVVS